MTASDLLTGLDPEQRAAASAVAGPVCILAGAGTGKTRTITHRVAHQIASGVAHADQVLAVTFTDRAAGELRERIAALGVGRVRAATFHAAAWAQLRHFWREWRNEPLPEVLDQPLRLLIPLGQRAGLLGRDLAAEISWAKARTLDPAGYAESGRSAPVEPETVAELYEAYERQKREQGLIDYDDMLTLCTRLLTERRDIAAQVRDRYQFFTVDEVQDTNPAQWDLLSAWLGDRDDLCVVGDDDQSIYSFTGATPRYLTGFTERFPHAQVVRLERNYRSTPQVLTTAGRVLGAQGKTLRPTLGDGPDPTLLPADDADEELALLVRRIERLREEGVPPAEIAVAYRINSQSQTIEEALRRAGIAYTVRGDVGFFARREIRQAVAALAEEQGRVGSVREDPPPPVEARPAGGPRPDRFVERVLGRRMGWHPKRAPEGETALERWRNLSALAALATRRTAEEPTLSVDRLVAELEQRVREGDGAPEPAEVEAVTLLTLHKAKGLEFEAVHLVAVEEGLIPISHARDDPDQVEEERRLLYVGCTRARRYLSLSWAQQREGPKGKPSRRRPSRFLDPLLDTRTRSAPDAREPRPRTARSDEGRRPHERGPADGDDEALVGALREWRRTRAHEDGVPAYVVCTDATLREVAARRPRTSAELATVTGLGPKRVARYGDDLLALVQRR
ncbi:ATP-dependent DNA helicase UvrD2 [Egibacter rhizosphaerae]|uniref:DNA 3'-5' helicase n=1 Tax=Egibacter rhizosphaerae TaxID=1670831 RepID=A0A411YCP5_9ACTN|nr:ATP-dependent DNA helicase UvrD2 [Egibacter rhizosphaerae]QBI18917.1 ATP-dependent DNA helicase UvrD2 [Egibacter rhizosphaerae]